VTAKWVNCSFLFPNLVSLGGGYIGHKINDWIGFAVEEIYISGKSKLVKNSLGYYQISPMPSQEELSEYYSSSYFQNPHGTYQESYSSDELLRFKLRAQLIIFNALKFIPKKAMALDIGCGEGFLLKEMLEVGLDATGMDFSEFGIKKYNPSVFDNFLMGDIYTTLDSLVTKRIRYDFVVLANVLEHVREPKKLIEMIYSILKPKGILAVIVPNDFSEFQLALKAHDKFEKEYWILPPDHLNYFSQSSLSNLLSESNFITEIELGDYPIEWSIANAHSNYALDPNLGKGAHNARIFVENFINSNPDLEAVSNFWKSLSSLGLGRTITSISRRSS
jgi:2-polyprenyl-3-methyl-5-hydroxy-6-metoxy-1,4-benzoquinol methylase